MDYTLEVIPKPRLDRILRELRQALEALYGDRLKGLYLYGSYARGEAEPGSDIDVAVVLSDALDIHTEAKATTPIVTRLLFDEECLVGLSFVEDEDWREGWSPFLHNLHDEAVAI